MTSSPWLGDMSQNQQNKSFFLNYGFQCCLDWGHLFFHINFGLSLLSYSKGSAEILFGLHICGLIWGRNYISTRDRTIKVHKMSLHLIRISFSFIQVLRFFFPMEVLCIPFNLEFFVLVAIVEGFHFNYIFWMLIAFVEMAILIFVLWSCI